MSFCFFDIAGEEVKSTEECREVVVYISAQKLQFEKVETGLFIPFPYFHTVEIPLQFKNDNTCGCGDI